LAYEPARKPIFHARELSRASIVGAIMLNADQIARVRAFFLELTRSPLYDTGFGGTVVAGGAQTVMSNADLIQSACYIQGAADTALRSQPFGTPQWHICQTMAFLCGAIRSYAKLSNAVADSTLDDLLYRYRREIVRLVQEKLES